MPETEKRKRVILSFKDFEGNDHEDMNIYELYGDLPKLNYSKWTAECDKLLNDGGLLVVYHKFVVPNPNPDKYFVVKRVFIGNRVWHLPRVCIYFQKKLSVGGGKT